jgi:2-iminoacetate synthase
MNTNTDIYSVLDNAGIDTRRDEYLWRIQSVTDADVRRELAREPGHFSLERLIVLISEAGGDFLEDMAQQAHALTLRRFGKTMQLYVPMYVSNYCINRCRYCGYNADHKFNRSRLTMEEAVQEAEAIASAGFRHILILSGEDPKHIDVDYLAELAKRLRSKFCAIEIEIYPLDTDGYKRLFDSGIDGLSIYQETYNRQLYKTLHAGPKSDYRYRLETPSRAAAAGFRRLGIGALLGLWDWRLETLSLSVHAAYLVKHHWQSQISFSFPRIRPAKDVEDQPYKHIISDRDFVQMMLALRLCFADAGIVVSTRESSEFRRHLMNLCVTRMSAGSKTNPGGYAVNKEAVCQFEVDDKSSPQQVAAMIEAAGYEPVWKDWDPAFTAG